MPSGLNKVNFWSIDSQMAGKDSRLCPQVSRSRGGACVSGWAKTSWCSGSVSVCTSVAPAPIPWAAVSNSSSTVIFSVWPRMYCWMGSSRPGMAISAIWALLAMLYWVGLYWTVIHCCRPRAPSMTAVSVISITSRESCIPVPQPFVLGEGRGADRVGAPVPALVPLALVQAAQDVLGDLVELGRGQRYLPGVHGHLSGDVFDVD